MKGGRKAAKHANAGGGPGTGGGGEPTGTLWSIAFAGAGDGAILEVGVGDTVLFDMATTPNYASVTVRGTLNITRLKSTQLKTKRLVVDGGTYFCGTRADPYPRGAFTHEWVATGLRADDVAVIANNMATSTTPESNRGCLVMNGGKWRWCSDVTGITTVVKIAADANVGASSLSVRSAMKLKAGDQLELTTTKYFNEGLSDAAAISDSGSSAPEYLRYPDTTRLPGWGQERVTVGADVNNSTTIPISQATTFDANHNPTNTTTLQHRHHGRLQYLVAPAYEDVAGTNLSYTRTQIVAGDNFGSVNGVTITGQKVLDAIATGANYVIDNCATVGLITHPLKYGAVNDSDWNVHGYGAHLMVMGNAAECQMEGVERYRVGQAGMLGRYPDHQHMRSYTPYLNSGSLGGTFLGDVNAATNFISKCSTTRSSNRGSTIHGTCGFTLSQNVYSYIDTHCIFYEDGSERRNVVDGNLVSGVRSIRFGKTPIKFHDRYTYVNGADTYSSFADAGASGIWNTNPDNYLRNNIVMGAFIGIWNTFACDSRFNPDDGNTDQYQFGCFGQSRNVEYAPMNHRNLEWKNNEAACCVSFNMRSQPRVVNESGGLGYGHFEAGRVLNLFETESNVFEGANLWKCEGWYNNEARAPRYLRWRASGTKPANTAIGNLKLAITGNAAPTHGALSFFDQALFCSTTLDDYYPNSTNSMMVSYNNGVNRINSIFVPAASTYGYIEGANGLPLAAQTGQVMRLWDFYLYPVQKGFVLDTNTVVLGSSPGWYGIRMPPLFMIATNHPITDFAQSYRDFVGSIANPWSQGNSGAMELPLGGAMFGQNGGWWVHDSPFLLSGVTGGVYAKSAPGLTNMNGVLVSSAYHFAGMQVERINNTEVFSDQPINYTRYQADGVTSISTWNTGAPQANYPNMRHAAFVDQGLSSVAIVGWDVPAFALSSYTKLLIALYAGNPRIAGQHVVLRCRWNGSTPITSCVFAAPGGPWPFAPRSSLANLIATNSRGYWVDTTNNRLWLHVCYDDVPGYSDADPILSFSRQNRVIKINVNNSSQ